MTVVAVVTLAVPDEEVEGVDVGPAPLGAEGEDEEHAVGRQEDTVTQELEDRMEDTKKVEKLRIWIGGMNGRHRE